MPSRLSYLVECFEPPLSLIFLMIDVGLTWRVRARSEVLSPVDGWGRNSHPHARPHCQTRGVNVRSVFFLKPGLML
jgi:hypothetical protein